MVREVTTVEGLKQGGNLHPIQEAFTEEHGLQCGFCTPGMMMTGVAFLQDNPSPSDDRHSEGYLRQPVPVHRVCEHRQGLPVRG